jgi:hypothetical protein
MNGNPRKRSRLLNFELQVTIALSQPGTMLKVSLAAGAASSLGNTPTWPPNSCEGGMGVAAATFNIPVPMLPLRQQ